MITPEESALLQEYCKAMEEHGAKAFIIETDVTTIMCVVATLHLAMRHPHFNGLTRETVEKVVKHIEERLREVSPVISKVVAQGNPT